METKRGLWLKKAAIAVAAAIFTSAVPLTGYAEDGNDVIRVFSDDFNAYGLSGLKYQKNQNGAWSAPYTDDDGVFHESTATDGNGNYLINSQDVTVARDADFGDSIWVAKTFNGLWGGWNTSAAGIVAAPKKTDDNALAICSYSTDVKTYPVIALNDITTIGNAVYTYKFDIYKSLSGFDGLTGGGIRFNVSEDRKSYYELQLPGNNGTVSGIGGIRKVTNGSETVLSSTSVDGKSLAGDEWYTVTLTAEGGIFEWTVLDGSGTARQTGRSVDAGDVITQDGAHIELFAGGQGNTFVLYDNLLITRKTQEEADDGTFEKLPLTQINAPAQGTEAVIAGKWRAPAVWTAPDIQILEDGEHGHVLAIESKKEWTQRPVYPTAYDSSVATAQNTAYNYKFDIKRVANDRGNGGGGIRFNYKDDSNFYELHFGSGNTGAGKGTMLYRRVKGQEELLAADIKTYFNDSEQTDNRLAANRWYTVDLKTSGGKIEWIVYDGDSIVSAGSYNDADAYADMSGTGTRFFGAGQYGAYVYFDNISVTPMTKDTGDFETFDTVTKKSDARWTLPIAGDWHIPCGQPEDAAFEIVQQSETNKALKITSAAAESEYESYAAIGNTDWRSTKDGVQTFDFDMWKGSFKCGGGIRFNVSRDGKNYYELAFVETNDREAGSETGEPERDNERPRTVLRRVENGESVLLTPALEINSEFEGVWNTITKYQGMKPEIWNTVHLEVIGGKITFTVSTKNNGQYMGGKTCISGSFTDSNPLAETDTGSYFVAYGGSIMIDNAVRTWEGIDDGSFDNLKTTDILTAASTGANYKDAKIGGDWYLRGRYSVNELSGADGDKAGFAIIKNPKGDGNVLRIETQSEWKTPWKYPMAYNRQWKADSLSKAVYKFDFCLNDARSGAGIRFNYIKKDEEHKSFYQLFFGGENCDKKTTLKKLSDGQLYREGAAGSSDISELPAQIVTEEGQSRTISGGKWYTAEVTVNGGDIRWTLKSQADGTLIETGSYTDDTPIAGTEMMAFLIGAGQNGSLAYFDNTSFGKSLSGEYEIKNYTGGKTEIYAPAETDAIVIFAAKKIGDTEQLTSVSYKAEKLSSGVNEINADSSFVDGDADTVKIMVWRAADSEPLCASAEYEVE